MFIGDKYALIAKYRGAPDLTDSAALYLVDLTTTSRQCRFWFPHLSGANGVRALELLCEPSAMWAPPAAGETPFHYSREERLIVLKMTISFFTTVTFAFLSSSLLAFIRDAGLADGELKDIPWSEWGYRHCRAETTPQWDGIWPCVVYGTRQVYVRFHESEDTSEEVENLQYQTVIEDYNQLTIRRLMNAPDTIASTVELCVGDTTLDVDSGEFTQPVTTSLPYREVTVFSGPAYFDYVMTSEDSILVVKVGSHLVDDNSSNLHWLFAGLDRRPRRRPTCRIPNFLCDAFDPCRVLAKCSKG